MSESTRPRKELKRLADMAHDRELSLYLTNLEKRFSDWRDGHISPSDLSDFIHEFHDRWARGVFKTYSNLDAAELVARAVAIGLLREGEISAPLRETISEAIRYFRQHYKIDEDDPLSQLRR